MAKWLQTYLRDNALKVLKKELFMSELENTFNAIQSPVDRANAMMKEGFHLIPDYMHGAVERYVINGIHPGSFLEAVLANDLMDSFGRADNTNRNNMWGWVQFVYNHLPATCHGSRAIVENWKGIENR